MDKTEKEKVKLRTMLEAEHPLEKLKCEGLHIGGVVFRCGSLHGASFEGSCMAGSKKGSPGDMSFSRCRFHSSNWNGSHLPETSFHACNMHGMEMDGACLSASIFCMSKAVDSRFRRAFLQGAMFDRTTLSYSDMRFSDLKGAAFRGCSLMKVKFRGSDLGNSMFVDCQICEGADLSGCSLRNALFWNCDLTGAIFSGADLRGARFIDCTLDAITVERQDETRGLDEAFPMACPAQGSFVAYKAASRVPGSGVESGGESVGEAGDDDDQCVIVALHVPEDARRVSAAGSKCRCSKARVVGITEIGGGQAYDKDGNALTRAVSFEDKFVYEIGKTVEVEDFDEDRFHECAPGIRFFMARELAEAY